MDTRIIARSPSTTATSASTSRANSTGVFFEMIQPLDRMTSRQAIAMPGSAVQTAHMIRSLARTPGAVLGVISLKSLVTPASSGRRVRSVKRKPVHIVAMAPNRRAEKTTTCTSAGAPMFNGTITAAPRIHGATVIADCRRRVFNADRRSSSVGSRMPSQRSAGATMRTAPTATIAVPTMITTAAPMTIVGVDLPRPVREMTSAVTSAVVSRYANVSPAA